MRAFLDIETTLRTNVEYWGRTVRAGLGSLTTDLVAGPRLVSVDDGREFLNMSSFSYLGLESHPKIIEAASEAVTKAGALNSSTSRTRAIFSMLRDTEDALTDLFRAETITTTSCAAAAWQMLPLLASGAFTGGDRPLMVFDENAYFCSNAMKPSVADETHLLTIPHNDLDILEDICKKNRNVVYIADSVYSTGDCAPVEELLALQDQYGLFLLFDEAHATSSFGAYGRGLALDAMGEINDRTVVITSLNKGFGASGGAVLLGRRGAKERRETCLLGGGPLLWSQRINTAGLGGLLASAEIHGTPELDLLQRKMRDNITHFDKLVHSSNPYENLPIRLVDIGEADRTIRVAQLLFESGFYADPLFFPAAAQGHAGLRVMLRADMAKSDITRFAELLNGFVSDTA